MIDELLKNETFLKVFPPLAALVFVLVFGTLGTWQLERAAEKNELLSLFEDDAPFTQPASFEGLQDFQRIEVYGQFLPERQVLIDNIALETRLGYYVITPFRSATDDALMLVNRGWVQKSGPAGDAPSIVTDAEFKTVQGMVGHLPRVGIRPGEAFEGPREWPRVGVYPTLDEIAAELGEPVLPVVLLLSPEVDYGFLRRWEPNISGPMTHYSYAFQWFAMAAAVIGIAAWHMTKRFRRDPGKT